MTLFYSNFGKFQVSTNFLAGDLFKNVILRYRGFKVSGPPFFTKFQVPAPISGQKMKKFEFSLNTTLEDHKLHQIDKYGGYNYSRALKKWINPLFWGHFEGIFPIYFPYIFQKYAENLWKLHYYIRTPFRETNWYLHSVKSAWKKEGSSFR